MSTLKTTVLGTEMQSVAFVAKLIHDAGYGVNGCVVEYAANEDDDDCSGKEDDEFNADIIVIAGENCKDLVAIKECLRNAAYPGLIVVVIVNNNIPVKNPGEEEGDWDRRNFHYGYPIAPAAFIGWFKRRYDDAVVMYGCGDPPRQLRLFLSAA